MADLIDRQAAIDALWKSLHAYEDKTERQFIESDELDVGDWMEHRIFVQNMNDSDRQAILELPSADIDLSGFSDKLWKTAYERGKAEAVRHGHWIRGSGYPHHIFCSICYATYVPNDEWDIWKTDGSDCFRLQRNFCPYCGARMDGEQDE